MSVKKLVRPNADASRKMIVTASGILSRLQQIDAAGQEHKATVQRTADLLFAQRVRHTLEAMDVEHINRARKGLRISLLREAGINNVYQASQLSFKQVCDIDGLGEQSAARIRDTIEQIKKNTEDTIRVRLNIESPDQADNVLVRALYVYIHSKKPAKECAELYHQHCAAVQHEMHIVQQGLNGLGWLFKSRKKKEEILDAVNSLQQRLAENFGDGLAIKAWDDVINTDLDHCWSDYSKNAPEYYLQLEELGIKWGKQDTVRGGMPAQLAEEIEQRPLNLKFLKATLRAYQSFGTKYIVHQKNTLLGDEMGLGKTIQAIAAMAALCAEGKSHFMVVCPASVLINWCREIEKHSMLEVYKVHGNDTEALLQWRRNGGVAVTTYESISRFTLPEKFRISAVVADEAHYVKNPETQRTKALLGLLARTEYTLFMSGTPLENNVDEMCFLVRCLRPDIAQQLDGVKYLSTAEQFRQQLAEVYLRRTREDVLQELPDLIEKEQWCTLGRVERKAYYDAVMSENFMAVRKVSWQVDDLSQSSKAIRLAELCEQAKSQNRKVIVFSFFRSTLHKVAELLGDRCMEPITGDVSPQRRQEIVDEFSNAQDGAVLISQVQAGGTGLNIQSASVIIFCEPQIKPSIENQAISRAYRMGQVRDVLVYRLLADDSIDERILELLKNKQNLFDNFADESVVGTESLKADERAAINAMMEEEKNRLLASEAV